MEYLKVSSNGRYLMCGDKPFFLLGDTAWLIFGNLSEEEAYIYLKNRADKGFNVIMGVLVYSLRETETVNKMYWNPLDINTLAYWEHVDRIIRMAEELGLYVALLPSWGSMLKTEVLREDNILTYGEFLVNRYKDFSNVLWVLGGDIKAADYVEIYRKLGRFIKEKSPKQLISFHPFGRCASTMWFADDEWVDFHMFQSGHRRYDQCSLGAWDDANDESNPSYFGEDNWKYVVRDYGLCDKPTLDGEPSYEWILQGLHDIKEPYWTAREVRRYAYWSVFAGACGHVYGDNSVMQFYRDGDPGVHYGAVCEWQEAIHHEASGQMQILKQLCEGVDYINGRRAEELVIGGQREKHGRIAVFAGRDFLLVYDYLGEEFSLDTKAYAGKDVYIVSPITGASSYMGKCGDVTTLQKYRRIEENHTDRVLVVR